MTEDIILLLYGAIVIASAFLIGSMSKLAVKEFHTAGPLNAIGSTYFWLAAGHAGSAVALTGICAIRAYDGLRGDTLGGSSLFMAWLLIGWFALLLVTKIGFNWVGTRDVKHGRLIWAAFVSSLVLWIIAVFARSVLT